MNNNGNSKIFPIINLGEILLREQQQSDLKDFMDYYTDPEVNKHILSHIPVDIEDGRREMRYWQQIFYNDDGIYFAIANKTNNKLIGSVGLNNFNRYHQRIEISYDIAKDFWRRGIASKAIVATIKYGFNNFNINRIEAFVASQNIASYNLLLKLGFSCEGTLRSHRFHKEKFFDVYSFSILRSDLAKPELMPIYN